MPSLLVISYSLFVIRYGLTVTSAGSRPARRIEGLGFEVVISDPDIQKIQEEFFHYSHLSYRCSG